MTFVEQSGSPYLSAFLAGTRAIIDFTIFDLQAGAAMTIHGSKVQYITGEIDRSKEYVAVPIDFQMLPNATDATAGGVSPVAITCANSQATSY